MRSNFILFVLFIIALNCFQVKVCAQSLTDKLGGINTHFEITTGQTEQLSQEQVMLKRAVSQHHIQTVCDGGAGYGYGYQSLHLEFFAQGKIKVVNAYDSKYKLLEFYMIKCYDANDTLIASFKSSIQNVRFTTDFPESNAAIYSIDLIKAPLVLLNDTKRLNIDFIRLSRRH